MLRTGEPNLKVAGIDVSSKTVTLVINPAGQAGKPREFKNTPQGHAPLIKRLRQMSVSRVCREATGRYHLDLALDEAGLAVLAINPKAAQRLAEAIQTRTKTDAAVLAQFALRMPVEPRQRPDGLALAIRAGARRIAALNQLPTQIQNQLHAVQQTATTPDFLLADLYRSIVHLDAQSERLRRQVLDPFRTHEDLQAIFDRLVSVIGIAAASAIPLLGERLVLPQDMRAKQGGAMAGLDPREHQSGSNVNKKPRGSKVGNRYLRIALYRPALSAARLDPHIRAYYHLLIETRGLKKLQAVGAVMRMLLLAIHAMLRNRTSFDGRRFYSPADTAA